MCLLALAEEPPLTKIMKISPADNLVASAVSLEKIKSNHFNMHTDNEQLCLKIYVTVDTKWVATLRQLIIKTFSGIVSLIRIEPIDHQKRMKVCLYFHGAFEDSLMTAIMRNLPSAEFGRITSAQ